MHRETTTEEKEMNNVKTIKHDGDTWEVIGMGVERDGQVFCHLASTTRVQGHQKNGVNPAQINDWVDLEVLEAAR